ncbi:TPA: hypothetical protein ACXP60_001829, partial [Klebsiella variicola subsp. variicola]
HLAWRITREPNQLILHYADIPISHSALFYAYLCNKNRRATYGRPHGYSAQGVVTFTICDVRSDNSII